VQSGLADVEHPVVEVDVGPSQAARLTRAEAEHEPVTASGPTGSVSAAASRAVAFSGVSERPAA